MKWHQLQKNRIIIVAIIVALVAIGTVVAIALTTNEKKSSGLGTGAKTEQTNEEDNGKGGLEGQDVLNEETEVKENSTSASGTWGDSDVEDNKGDKENTSDSNATQNGGNSSDEDEEKDILEDDTVWGDIY